MKFWGGVLCRDPRMFSPPGVLLSDDTMSDTDEGTHVLQRWRESPTPYPRLQETSRVLSINPSSKDEHPTGNRAEGDILSAEYTCNQNRV